MTRLKNSPAWQDFYRMLSVQEKQNMARPGIMGWPTSRRCRHCSGLNVTSALIFTCMSTIVLKLG